MRRVSSLVVIVLVPTVLAVLAAGTPLRAQHRPIADTTTADNEPALMLVLDGSGSMWAKMGKEQKINVVRDALKATLPKAPPMSVGLTAYGHRRTGDCSDVEVAVPLAKGNGERLTAYIDKYNPKGKGPLGNAIKAAAEGLADQAPQGVRRSMIVITDNADNCKVDTCELAQELRQSHPGLAIHVIALGVSKEEMVPLTCLPSATGGRLLKAETTADITGAIEQTLRLAATGSSLVTPSGPAAQPTALQQPAAPAKPEAPPLPPTPGLQLSAILGPGGQSITTGLRWRITTEQGAKSGERRVLYEGEDPTPDLELPPGTYRVEAVLGLVSHEQTVAVGAGTRTRLQVALNAGTIAVKDSGARNGPATDRVFYTLYAAAAGAQDQPRALALSSDALPVYNVPAGTYIIAVQQGLARIERSVTITPGAVADVDIPLYLGQLQLSAVVTEGGTPLERVVFQVFEDDPDSSGGVRELVRSSAAAPEFSLPAGSYHVIARDEAAEARERVTITPGTRTSKVIVLASGRLSLTSRMRGQGRLEPAFISYRIERLGAARQNRADGRADSRGEEVSRVQTPEHALALSAGRYRVEGRYGPINARSVREFEVKAGTNQALVLEHDAGLVTLKAIADKTTSTVAPAEAAVLWQLADANGQTIWSTGQSSPRLPLAAGRYIVRAESRNARGEQQIQVQAGDDRTVEIELTP